MITPSIRATSTLPTAHESSRPDRDLLERLRAGEEKAFEEFVTRHDGALRRVARSFVRSPATADDVVQETWMAVIRGLEHFEGRSSLSTWIFRILINRARTRAVRDARWVPFSALEDDDRPAVDSEAFTEDGRWRSAPARLEGDPERSLLVAHTRTLLVQAIEQLAPAQRVVITLRDVVGLDAREVTSLLEITDANQRVLLHRARARVRAALVDVLEVSG